MRGLVVGCEHLSRWASSNWTSTTYDSATLRSARSRSAQRSSTASIPTLSRSSAGGRCSCPGMLARRSMVDSTAPRLVACWMSCSSAHTASAASAVATHVERDDRAESFELASRGLVSRVARQAGIARQSDVWMAREAFGQGHRVALRPLQPQCQRSDPADREKGFEGAGCCARELPGLPQRRQQVRVAHGDDAAEQVRVSADELRHRLHGHVGPERQWTLIERRSEGVVHAQDRATLPRCGADGVQVTHRQQRVRRRLQPNQVGHAAHLDPACGVGHGRRDARSTGRGFGQRWRVPRHPGSSRPAAPPPSPRGVDRKSPRSPPCRRRRRPKSRLRGRRRSLPGPPSPACRRRESTHGARPARSSTPGIGGTLSGEPGRRSRPAETSHDSTEPESALCAVVCLDVITRF